MSICYIFVVVSLLNFLNNFHVKANDCDKNCAEKPVFSPSRLVVMFGDPSSTMCTVCERCTNAFGLEKALGKHIENGTRITWQADSVTEWDLPLLCYYEKYMNESNPKFPQCCSMLSVTVYKPLDDVSISFVSHTGPLYEGRQYTLQCTVHDVAPVGNLIVTFYRGQTILGQLQSNTITKKPVTDIFTLNIIPSKEDDGVKYWCEAKLELGPEGPQPPPVVESQNITATVYYKPQLQVSSPPDLITVIEGDPLKLDCSAVGNPSPSYSWTLPSNSLSPSTDRVLTINSTTSEDKGVYSCYVSNTEGDFTVKFNVNVKVSYSRYIIPLVLIVVAVIVCVTVVVHYHRKYRRGQYNLKDIFHLYPRHSAVPITDGVTCWGSGLRVADNNRLNKLIRMAGDVVGEELDTLTTVAERRMLSRLQSILDNVAHPLYDTLAQQRSTFSRRLLSPRCTTERHRKSFLPVVINLYNASLRESDTPPL